MLGDGHGAGAYWYCHGSVLSILLLYPWVCPSAPDPVSNEIHGKMATGRPNGLPVAIELVGHGPKPMVLFLFGS